MKIYRRADFLKLPAGTLYCSGKEWVFCELSVKGETISEGEDFLCLGLEWIEAFNDHAAIDRLTEMLEKDASYPMQESYGRDGMFDDSALYLVYETADLKKLIEIFHRSMIG